MQSIPTYESVYLAIDLPVSLAAYQEGVNGAGRGEVGGSGRLPLKNKK